MADEDLPAPLARLDAYAGEYEQCIDPMSGFMCALSWVVVVRLATEPWTEWDKLTTVGKVTYALLAPVYAAAGVVALALALVTSVWVGAQVAVFAGGPKLLAWWRRAAYKDRGQLLGPPPGWSLLLLALPLILAVMLVALALGDLTVADPAAFERAAAQSETSAEAPPLVTIPIAFALALVISLLVSVVKRTDGGDEA